MGQLEQAEKYLNSAWTLSLGGTVADHLGQVYEQQHNKQAAVRMYRLALFSLPLQGLLGSGEAEKTRERLERLSPGSSAAYRTNFSDVSDAVNQLRTVKLPRLVQGKAEADFYVVFARNGKTSSVKVEDVKFISGSENLKSAGKALQSASFKVVLPDEGTPRILRRGILACYENSGCSFTLLLTNDMRPPN